MSIQHSSITDPNIHEPKGVSIAAANTLYTANGSGSGTWKKVDSLTLSGLSGDSGSSDKKILTNGTNGFRIALDSAYGTMAVTNNTTPFPVTAVADTTFNTPSQFVLLTGVGATWAAENLHGITFNTDRLIVPVTGDYLIHSRGDISSFPSANARIALRYRINGGAAFSSRFPIVKAAAVGDEGQIHGFGLISLNAGDFIQLYLASDNTGNIVFRHFNNVLKLERQTA